MTALQKFARQRALGADPVAFLPMVERLARRLARRLPAHIEVADLVGAGVLGLMEALQRYDAERAVSFHSYAAFRVRGAWRLFARRQLADVNSAAPRASVSPAQLIVCGLAP